jgi:hypothetical protein
LDDRIEHRIQRLADVLDEESVSILQCALELAQEVVLSESHHLQVAVWGGLLLPQPLDALQLRVDDERPARGAAHDGSVLRGHLIRRQSIRSPSSDFLE